MLRFFVFLLFALALNAAQNTRTLGLESFLGGNAGEKGEIELAKIRIENLKAMKKELEDEARALAQKAKENEPVFVDANSDEVAVLLEQIASLKNQIHALKNANATEMPQEPKNTQGVYLSTDEIVSLPQQEAKKDDLNLLKNACDANDGDACNNLALLTNKKELFEKACELNSALGCANLSILLLGEDEKKAELLTIKACSLGDKSSCK